MEEKTGVKEKGISDKDWFLQSLVEACNQGMELTITLLVKGIVISGTLVGGNNYFVNIAENFKTITKNPDETEKTYSHFKKIGEDIYTIKEDEVISPPTFIHIKGARIFHPGQKPMPKDKTSFWRGKIDSVDGFYIGEFLIS